MKTWEQVVNEFADHWRIKKGVIGILVTGSRVIGTATKFSDIDIHVILADDVNWRLRGNKLIDGYMVEYFVNPLKQLNYYVQEAFTKNSKGHLRMFLTGKILYDKMGEIAKLKRQYSKKFNKSFNKPSKTEVELFKYQFWHDLDELKDLQSDHSPVFNLLYFELLKYIYTTYSKFLGIEVSATGKLYKFLESQDFRKKYQIQTFPDKSFTKLFLKALTISSYKNLESLVNYTTKKMGGFNINDWQLKTPVVLK